MKPERINQVIAEYCGWTCFGLWNGNPIQIAAFPPNGKVSCIIPDYHSDLNAMNEAEQSLPQEAHEKYLDMLYAVCNPEGMFDDSWKLNTSPAPQRAEAFLRTIGKWEEDI